MNEEISLIAYWLFHEAILIELFKTDAQIILNDNLFLFYFLRSGDC